MSRGRFEWFNLIFENNELAATERLVAAYLWKRADYSDGVHRAWPTYVEIADRTSRSVNAVKTAIRGLKRAGWLEQSKRSFPGGNFSYEYRLTIPGRHHPDVRDAPAEIVEEARDLIISELNGELEECDEPWERERLIGRRLPEFVRVIRDL